MFVYKTLHKKWLKPIDKPILINYIDNIETTKKELIMATKKNIGKNYEGKLFCVSTARYIDGKEASPTIVPKLYVSLASAMEEVAGIVNETLAYEKKKKRVKPMDCADALLGGYVLPTGDGRIVISITAFERPWSVQYMDCDNMEHNVELFSDKESAEQAVAKKAKAGIKELGYDKPEYIYADHNGDCEIETKSIKKSEPYIKVDTIGGNHITWEAKQI